MSIAQTLAMTTLCTVALTSAVQAGNEDYNGTDKGTPITLPLPEIVGSHLSPEVDGSAVRVLKNGCYIFEYEGSLYQIID